MHRHRGPWRDLHGLLILPAAIVAGLITAAGVAGYLTGAHP